MAAPFISHSQYAVIDALGLYATEATAVQHYESELRYTDPWLRYTHAAPGPIWWSGSLSGLVNDPLMFAPTPYVVVFQPLAPSTQMPVIYGIEYELTIRQETVNWYLHNASPYVPSVVAHTPNSISGSWRYSGFMADVTYPIDDSLLVNQRWSARWSVVDGIDIETIAKIDQMQLSMKDGLVEVEMTGHTNASISSSIAVNPSGMWGTVQTGLGKKTIAGPCIVTGVTIGRDCGRMRMSAEWINRGLMTVS